VPRRDAEAVVLDSDDPVRSALPGGDANFERDFAPIFHGVTHQVLEEAYQMNFVAQDDRQPGAPVPWNTFQALHEGQAGISLQATFAHAWA
jgi:hypothetical protein